MRGEIMFWALMAVITAISIAVPRFRRAGLSIVGIAILTVVAVIAITQQYHSSAPPPATPDLPNPSRRIDMDALEWERLDKADPGAKDRIAPEHVRFDQVRATPGSLPRTLEAVQARLYNDSGQFTLTHYAYYLVVQDCVAAQCTTVYDQRGRETLDIPPNQARDVTLAIRDPSADQPPPFRLLGSPKIVLIVTETRAAAVP